MNNLKQKMKFLAIKLAALRSEIAVSREILQNASREVDSMFNEKYFPEIPVEKEDSKDTDLDTESEERTVHPEDADYSEQVQSEGEKEDTASADKDTDPEVKKMFRKIALEIHPDKLEDLDDGFEKKKKKELFERARQALENNDILILSDVAMELGIEIPEITEYKLKQTEQKIIAIKKELNQIESTMVWHWFFTSDKEQKTAILEKLFELMYANNPRP
jgi:hypothetical protein